MSLADEIKKLEDVLENADFQYYNFGTSPLSDEQYDQLVDKLQKICPTNKRFSNKKVGAVEPKSNGWKKFSHDNYPMGSQNKVTNYTDMHQWCSCTTNNSIVVQDKLDGISIKLIYDDTGSLIHAVTRGDGTEGEDILRNVIKMEGIPSKIQYNKPLIIRGEIILYKSNMVSFADAKTARNMASGIAKRLDGKDASYLNIKVYDIMNWKDLGLQTNTDIINLLKSLGFDTVNTYYAKNSKEVETIYQQYIDATRQSLDFDIDGLVIKDNALHSDDWKHPKYNVAYKFPPKRGITKLLNVSWQDSGGRICPVAILEPVIIDGVTISKATLNNIDHIAKLKIKIGDTVEVSRRNDVIPCIEKVIIEGTTRCDIIPPTKDSEGFDIVRERNVEGKELAFLVSTNPNSKSKRIRRIVKWFHVHDAKGVAEATVEAIIDAGLAKDLPDFYDLCINGSDKLLELDGFGLSTYKIMKKAALKTSTTNLITFLSALDIEGFSDKSYTLICESINKSTSLKDFIDYIKDTNNTSSIGGFGSNSAKTLKNNVRERLQLIKEMNSRVTIESWNPVKPSSTKINGLSFCFTGKMSHDRSELEKLVKSNGGIVSGVNKDLDYLVTDDPNSGSSKNKKADQYGIKKITETEFLKMIN